MKLTYTALMAALGVAGAAPVFMNKDAAIAETVETFADAWYPTQFRLNVVGQDESCIVALDEAAALTLEPICSKLFQPLSEARFWQEQPSGDILLMTTHGRTVAQFFPGDGVAYESVEPAAPIMMLSLL